MAKKKNYNIDINECLETTLSNIQDDRSTTKIVLTDILLHVKKDVERQEKYGLLISKYIETLQRSNEQLIKLSSLINKTDVSDNLTEKDKEDLYNILQDQGE